MKNCWRYCFAFALGLLLPMCFCGCDAGPELGLVSGTITINGVPVEQATITFTPVDGQSAFARTDANGFYELQFSGGKRGTLLGENYISIETGHFGTDERGELVEYPEQLPSKYNSESEIVREVKAGSQVFDFAIEL